MQRTDLSQLQDEKWIDSGSPSDEGKGGSALATSLPGVTVQKDIDQGNEVWSGTFIVGWDGDDDPMKPQNWSMPRRWMASVMLCLISMIVSCASSVDAPVIPQSSEAFHVGEAAGSLTTGEKNRAIVI